MHTISDPTFADLHLPRPILDAITAQGYHTPTAIQVQAIPPLLDGRDVIGVAQTGTGKTAAFGLPLISKLDPSSRRVQALVLAPTRELAQQDEQALASFAATSPGVNTVAIYGGAPFSPQRRALSAGVQVVVGTPGRIIDHLERGTLRLDAVRFVVLDEGDEMLRMGFAEDVDRILSELPERRQIALFSATMPAAIRRTADQHLRDPLEISVARQSSTVAAIDQRFAVVPFRRKTLALARILGNFDAEAALVFVRTRAAAEEVGVALNKRGITASVISGDVPQAEREKTVNRLRDGQVRVLVATDVAARGLDVDRIGLVVNFDLPDDGETYVHRIGRTGRAGRTGVAFSFVTPGESGKLKRIERVIRKPLVATEIPRTGEVVSRRAAALLRLVPDRVAAGRLKASRGAVRDYLAGFGELSAADQIDLLSDLAAALTAFAVGDDLADRDEDESFDAELDRGVSKAGTKQPDRSRQRKGHAGRRSGSWGAGERSKGSRHSGDRFGGGGRAHRRGGEREQTEAGRHQGGSDQGRGGRSDYERGGRGDYERRGRGEHEAKRGRGEYERGGHRPWQDGESTRPKKRRKPRW